MSQSTFERLKRELLARNNDPRKVRAVIRILTMSARSRIRAFEKGKFDDSVWTYFGHVSRKYAASRNLRTRIVRTDPHFFCIDH